jgi:hypothetical protein
MGWTLHDLRALTVDEYGVLVEQLNEEAKRPADG